MWTFSDPAYLLLFLALPFLIYFRHFWKGRGSRLVLPLTLWEGQRFSTKNSFRSFLNFLSAVFFWLSLALILFALAGPALTLQQKIFLNSGTDVMIVLDESPSMGARDFPPQSRFEAAKLVIERFIKSLQNDPVGLVTFGQDAVLNVPLTTDYKFFQDSLRKRKLMELGDGTALGMGIAVAAEHLRVASGQNKVMIVLTDGDNNAGEIQPGTAVGLLASLGIHYYLVGIGTPGKVPLEVTDPTSGLTYFGTLEGGFHENYLKSLANPPYGVYFSANSSGSLDSIFQAIDSREMVTHRVKLQVLNVPLYQVFVPVALGFLALFLLVRKVFLKELL
jgi:Ca-activated chloride channel family protein